MAISVFKTFSAGEILTASDLNSSLTQITGNGEDLAWPATKTKDFNGQNASGIKDLTTATVTLSQGITSGGNIVSDTDSTDSLGTTAVRWANSFFDAITVTNNVIADAQGLITSGTTVDGVGIASVSTSGTGIYTVVFDNPATGIDKQACVASASSGSAYQVSSTNNNADPGRVRIKQWLDAGGSIAVADNFPVSIVRFIF